MKRTFISLGVAFLVVALIYISIFFFDPGMNVEKAFNIIVLSFIGSAVVTALVLMLRGRRR
jgi:ABC-type Fe3+-siderophore transport system permease subunit